MKSEARTNKNSPKIIGFSMLWQIIKMQVEKHTEQETVKVTGKETDIVKCR